jgi:hypothetical protein
MQVTFKNDDEKMQFISYLERFEIDNDLPAFDLIAIFQAYESSLKERYEMSEKMSKAYSYASVTVSTLKGE